MEQTNTRYYLLVLSYVTLSLIYISCNQTNLLDLSFFRSYDRGPSDDSNVSSVHSTGLNIKTKALMSTRFENLEQLKTTVSIHYDKDYSKLDSSECLSSSATLQYICNGEKICRIYCSGINQGDLINLQTADYVTKCKFVLSQPNAIRQRNDLEKVYILARRRADLFGPGDVAFYDLAEASFLHINTPELAFQNRRDSTEKGYINTFNHITAQAIISSFFSETLAERIGDLHERYHMPQLSSGRFTETQLRDSLNHPVDNYVDLINNEIGQKIGLELKEKYKLNEYTSCTPNLIADYLNDLQTYYMWSLAIGMDPFRSTDELIIKFSNKLNFIRNRT